MLVKTNDAILPNVPEVISIVFCLYLSLETINELMATNVSLPSCGVSTPATAQVGKPETITVESSTPKPKSKARLLFNTDGSVKLLGDPSLFPGSGIDSNSHNLVPTVGPDGKMTMLLTPLGPEGKTFILNPTNGCSLPKNFPLLNPVAKSTDAATAPAVTNSTASSKVTVSNSSQPVVIKTNEFKSSSQQKSLLAGFTKLTIPVNSPQYVTHMRIDPSGACTSTVKVPVNREDEDHSRSSTLRAIADRINPDNANQPKKSLLSNILGETVEKKKTVESKPTSAMKCIIAPNGKLVKETKSNWSNLSSVSPKTPNIILHQNRNNSQKTGVPKSVYPPRIVPPPIPNVRWPGPNQFPAATKDKPMTYILLPPTTSDSARTGQPSLISTSNVVSSIPNTSTISSAPQIRLSAKTQITTTPSRYLYRTLSTDGDSKFVVYPTKPVQVTDKNPQVVSATSGIVQGDTKTQSQPVNNINEANEVSYPSTDDSKTLINQGNENEITLDPSTGLLASPSDEDDSLCIKIDSVFSLSTKNETEDQPADDIKEEHIDPECGEDSVKVKPESTQSEAVTVTCNPVYVVLDRLSEHQIAHYKTSIVKCSDYCRKRTLNFLCNLGLVDCEPTVHKIHPKQDTIEKDNTKSLLEQSNKRKLENENSDQGSKITKKDSVSEENAKTVSNVSEQSEHKTAPQTDGSPPCPNVRKVESPGSAKTKVLKFTKLDKEQLLPKPPIVIFDSMQAKHQPDVVNSPAIPQKTSPVNIQASKVMTGLSPVQIGVQSSVPITKLQDNTKKQYFLFNVNGQNILVPTSNDMQKPKAFMLKGNDSKLPQVIPSRKLPPALSKVSLLNGTVPPKVTTVPNTNHSNQKRPLEVTLSHENPKKVLKPDIQKEEMVIPGIRIKSEPITHGYGDEEPVKSKSKNSKVKVKKEPKDNGWQEIWSSPSTPLPDPTRTKTKPKTLTTSSKESQEKSLKGCEESPRSPDMPDLPMMRVPSSEEIAKSSATHKDRIERLKALLKTKEKLIEDLKEKRLKEGNILDDELFADSGPSVSQVKNHWDSNTGQTTTGDTIPGATAGESSEFDKIGSSDTESCEPCWSSFDVNDDIN